MGRLNPRGRGPAIAPTDTDFSARRHAVRTPSDTPGLHHVTGIVGDPAAGAALYGETLGLRLLRRTVKDRPQLRRIELMRGSIEVP